MTNFYFQDKNGQKAGPINDQQLKTLAAKGVITPQTLLETDTGHKGLAGQIQGLFATPAPSPFTQAVPPPLPMAAAPMTIAVPRATKVNPLIFGAVAVGVLALIVIVIGGIWAMSSSTFTADDRMEISAFLANPESSGKSNEVLLSWQAGQGKLTIVKYLLSRGTDVNAQPKELSNFAPLHSAAMNGHLDVVKYLVGKGADADLANSVGITPVMLAASGGHFETVKYLVSKGADVKGSKVVGAAMSRPRYELDNYEVIKFLISKGGDVNTKGKDDNTLLHEYCKLDQIKFLVAHGADVHARGEYDKTPLHQAFVMDVDAIEFLLSKGADVNAKDKFKYIPLHTAAQQCQSAKNLDVVKFLVSKGADVNARDHLGQTPLDCAKGERYLADDEWHIACIKYLSGLK